MADDADDLYSDLYGDDGDVGGVDWLAADGDAGDDGAAPASPGAAALASPPPAAAASAAPAAAAAAPAPARSSFIPPGSAAASTSAASSFIPPAPAAAAAARPAFLPPAPQTASEPYANRTYSPPPPNARVSAAIAGDGWQGAAHAAAQQQQRQSADERKVMPHEMPDEGKMFIGGLNWETTDEGLKQYFSQFGRVSHCTIMREAGTNRSRGFAFLAFAEPATVNVVMVKEHFLDGKMIDPKRAIPRGDSANAATSRCFVGSVPQSATSEVFRKTFEPFGTLTECNMLLDGATGRPRGFGFVSFTDEASAQKCMGSQPLYINGEQIEVKRAQPRGDARKTSATDGERRPLRRDGGSGSYGADGLGGSPAQQQQAAPLGGAVAGAFDPHAMAAMFQQTGWGANFNPLLMQQMMMGGMGMMPGIGGMPGMQGMGMPGFGMPQMGMAGMPMMPFGQQQHQQGWSNGGGAGHGGQQGSPPYHNGGQSGGRPAPSRERSFGNGGGERSGSAEAGLPLPRAPLCLPRRPDVAVPPPLSQRERGGPTGAGSGGGGGDGGGRGRGPPGPQPSGNNWARINDHDAPGNGHRGRSRSPGRGSTYTPGGGGGGRDRERERSPRRHGGGGGGGGGEQRRY